MQRDLAAIPPRRRPRLLQAADPDPVICRDGRAGVLLTVEHAGRAVPAALGDLDLPAGQIDRHIGWDIGAMDLAEAMAARLGASLVAQRYSRIVIDCNRPWDAPDLVPETTDRTRVPANRDLSEADRRRRWDEIHAPFHAAVAARCDAGARALVAVHSYDPKRDVDGAERPWPVGLVWRQDNPLAEGLARRLRGDARAMPLGIHEPYEIEDVSDYTIPVHAEPRDLPHVLVEVRNDLLRDAAGVARMAALLADAVAEQFP